MAEQRFHTEITASASQFNAEMDAAAQRMITDAQKMQSSWRDGFYQMGQNAAGMAKEMNSQFDDVKKTIVSFRGAIAGAAAAIGAAGFLIKFASDASKATVETGKLASMLGTTTQEASALKIALDDIGVETDTYTGMVGKMTMKLREGEERFNELGVKTRGANKELLSTDEIVQNALQALLKFKEGTDRNLASTELFGKGWQELNRVMKLTPETMEEARKKARELELEIGPEGAARAELYKRAMNDIGDVYGALKNRIGQALMPVLSDFAEWMSSLGPKAVIGMRGVVGGFVTVWYGLANAVTIVWQLVKAFLFSVTEPLVGFGEAMALALSGNFAAAGARLRQTIPNVKAAWENAFEETLKSSEKTRDRLKALFDPNAEQGKGSAPKTGGDKPYTPKKEASASRVSGFEAELAARRDAYDKEQMLAGTFQQFTKQMERDFWKNILDTQKLSKEEQAAVSKKFFAVERDIRKEAFELEIADIKARIEAHKQGSVERILLAGESANRIGQMYGLESKEYRQAVAEMSKMARERHAQQNKLDELALESERSYQISRVTLERQNLDTLESLGIITAKQKLARLRELAGIEFQINLQSAEKNAELIESDVVAHQQALDKIAEMKRQHAAELNKIDGEIAKDRKKTIDAWIDPVTQAMSGMVNGVFQGTQTMQQMFANAMRNIALSYANALLKMGADWLKTKIFQSLSTAAGAGAQTAAAATGGAAASGGMFGEAVTVLRGIFYDPAKDVMKTVEKSSTDVISSVGQNSNSVIGAMGTSMVSWWSHLGDMTSGAFSGISALFSSAFGGLMTSLGNVGSTLWSWASSIGSTLWDWASSIGSSLWTSLSGVGSTLWSWASSIGTTLGGWASSIGTTLGGWAGSIGSTVWGAVQSFGGWISEAGSTLWSWAGSIGSDLGGWAGEIGSTLWGWASTIGGMLGNVFSSITGGISSFFGGGGGGGGGGGIFDIVRGVSGAGNFADFAGGYAAIEGLSAAEAAAMIESGTVGFAGAGMESAALGMGLAEGAASFVPYVGWAMLAAQMLGIDVGGAFGDLGGAIGDVAGGIGDAVSDVFGGIGDIFGFAEGTNYVPRDMLAMVHKGEAILPPDANPFAGGGGLTVHFNGVIDAQSFWDNNQSEIVRVLTNAQRTFSTGFS